jgi:hypothetical protein
MPVSNQPTQSTSRLADRLAAARRGRFVGREAELELFRSALLAVEPPFAVLHIYGPGGVGKSTLLREYARLAGEAGRPVILLDRDVEPSPPGFGLALRRVLGLGEDSAELPIAHWPPNAVLLIDTYELLAPIDGWLRETFLPQLSADSLVVIAGRNSPISAWRADIAWGELSHFLPLRNLRPEESQTYLAARGIPEEQHAEVLTFTHGHPLALSLVAEVINQGDKLTAFNPQADPDVVRILLERFTRNVSGPKHRQALEVCAHVRTTTEALLSGMLGVENGPELFQWLRERSFIEQGPQGLFPHDLAREVLDADWRWRNFQAYQTMHHQVRRFYEQELQQGGPQSALSADLVYLLRYYAAMNPYFDWDILSQAYMEPATTDDHPFILETLQHHEGTDSVEIARYWLHRQPEAFIVFRTTQDRQLGFVVTLMLSSVSEADVKADPALAAVQSFLRRHGPLRPNEVLNFVRFWMGRENYQMADIQSLVAMNSTVAWINNPHMAWTFAAVADPHHWQAMFTMFNFDYTEEADFVAGGHRYGVFTHNWRTEPVADWFDWLGAQHFSANLNVGRAAPHAPPPLITLSKPEFAEAVRQALRDYTRLDMLASNPLMRSRLVAEVAASSVPETLQTLLRQAAATLTGNPRDEKLYRAIYHTYLDPAPTQERAAEMLDLPFNTYRYHLSNGLKRITASLWQRELQ